jgi:uncharacterized protein YPO0396
MSRLSREAAALSRFVLTQIDLYDWGAFGGRHSAQIDPRGSAVIGPTGSGKTTLIDALMTLLTANPRYNLASTGGHESDRDLASYVRGVTGTGNNSGENEHIARNGAVVSGIAARFGTADAMLRIGAVFWFDGSSSALADLKRRWFFCEVETPGLDEWLEAHRSGGARALKQLESDTAGLKLFENKSTFLARLRSHFDVGENAFNLLNRAAGLKQLNSIDEVFRELVLDDRTMFAQAAKVAGEFDTLSDIHAALGIARRQRDTLLPIRERWRERLQWQDTLGLQQRLQTLLPVWFATHAAQLWQARCAGLEEDMAQQRERETAQCAVVAARDSERLRLYTEYLQHGGENLDQVRTDLERQQRERMQCEERARQYQRLAAQLQRPTQLEAAVLAHNQVWARQQQPVLQTQLERHKETLYDTIARRAQQREETARLEAEFTAVRSRPDSNIPPLHQQFRAELAQHLGIREDAVPFVAELVQVKETQADWRGAIERALGAERLRLLVEPALVARALAWINGRNNRLDVRLREAEAVSTPAVFFDDGFVRKLNFKPHALREPLKQLLAGLDRHCVDISRLRDTPFALTIEGMTSGRHGWYDKRDAKPLASEWMTGFDNRDRLRGLTQSIDAAQSARAQADADCAEAESIAEQTQQQLLLLDSLIALDFALIDLPRAQQAEEHSQARLVELTRADSDTAQARRRWEQADLAWNAAQDELTHLRTRLSALQVQHDSASQKTRQALRLAGDGLGDDESALAAHHLVAPQSGDRDRLDELERLRGGEIAEAIKQASHRLGQVNQALVGDMGRAQKADTGELSEFGTTAEEAPHYLERLRVLVEEALPEKMQRFQQYLNESSDQGVRLLLSEIEEEVSAIEERIADLNRTLFRVDFQPGRYLQLEPLRVRHQSLRSLEEARSQLRAAMLKDDQGESHYTALRHMVDLLREAADKPKTLGARALLDPRHRLSFAVSVIERSSGAVIETRTSSQGGSGGEKEIIASYVLTASLSYALAPRDGGPCVFSSIVLDEAFSKSSQAVAGRIIQALREFGLHALFVTPNKELRLLRTHTRSAILVHRRGQQASLTSITWEELEDFAQQRSRKSHEIAG